mmetsp:Transcript_5512/g.15459  ORF Transcript_5512/g.15459 Transcript_5512/m.15459 type:complete len:342 (-) Transcript_5512:422-1447(-)
MSCAGTETMCPQQPCGSRSSRQISKTARSAAAIANAPADTQFEYTKEPSTRTVLLRSSTCWLFGSRSSVTTLHFLGEPVTSVKIARSATTAAKLRESQAAGASPSSCSARTNAQSAFSSGSALNSHSERTSPTMWCTLIRCMCSVVPVRPRPAATWRLATWSRHSVLRLDITCTSLPGVTKPAMACKMSGKSSGQPSTNTVLGLPDGSITDPKPFRTGLRQETNDASSSSSVCRERRNNGGGKPGGVGDVGVATVATRATSPSMCRAADALGASIRSRSPSRRTQAPSHTSCGGAGPSKKERAAASSSALSGRTPQSTASGKCAHASRMVTPNIRFGTSTK